jgi:hypothetical protein
VGREGASAVSLPFMTGKNIEIFCHFCYFGHGEIVRVAKTFFIFSTHDDEIISQNLNITINGENLHDHPTWLLQSCIKMSDSL